MTPVVEDVAKAAKDFFPNFEIAKINNHLRLTKNVSEEVQRLALHSSPGVPNNVLMSNSNLPSNIAEGHPVVNIQDKHFIPTLKECLSLTEGLKTVIVVDSNFTVPADVLEKNAFIYAFARMLVARVSLKAKPPFAQNAFCRRLKRFIVYNASF